MTQNLGKDHGYLNGASQGASHGAEQARDASSLVAANVKDGLHYRACNLCEAMCGLEIRVEGATIRAIRGDKRDPFSRGHICAKAVALQDLHEDPDRLRKPLLRKGDSFEEVSWDEALDAAAEGLRKVRDQHGTRALAIYAGNPTVHNSGAMLFNPLLYRALGAKNRYSATSVDQLPHHLAAYFMFGHQLLLPVPDIDRSDYFLILGANPVVSNGSLMTAPDFRHRMSAICERGGTVVVVDPRRSETAALASRHLPIRPGGDAFLLAAMLHTIFVEDLAAPGRLASFTDGLDELPSLFAAFTPESVAEICGIAAEDIVRLAREFCAASAAVAHGRMGLSVQEYGGLCQWLVNLLNLVTGNLDRAGGAMFTTPAIDAVASTGRGGYARFASRVRKLPEFGGELPVASMAEDMLAPGDGQPLALVTIAGNPVLSTPNGAQLDRALDGLEFQVSIDIYLNETTRHADVILPPTATLERDHYDLIFHLLAIRNTARYSPALFEPAAGAMHDWQIALALSQRLQAGGLGERLRATLVRWYMGRLGPAGIIDRQLAKGPHRDVARLADLRAAPHGIDLGALQQRLPERLHTANRRIVAAPPALAADLQRLRTDLTGERRQTANNADRMLLISRRQPRSNNSWMHNFRRLVKGKPACTLLVHPDDATRLGLRAGADARVRSRVGEVRAPVELDDGIMPGVVSLPHGWGHDRAGTRMSIARAHAGASVNDLTDEQRVDPLSGNAALSGVPVDIAPA